MVATTARAPRVDNATTVNAQQTNAMTGMAEKRIMSAENVCPRQRAITFELTFFGHVPLCCWGIFSGFTLRQCCKISSNIVSAYP